MRFVGYVFIEGRKANVILNEVVTVTFPEHRGVPVT